MEIPRNKNVKGSITEVKDAIPVGEDATMNSDSSEGVADEEVQTLSEASEAESDNGEE